MLHSGLECTFFKDTSARIMLFNMYAGIQMGAGKNQTVKNFDTDDLPTLRWIRFGIGRAVSFAPWRHSGTATGIQGVLDVRIAAGFGAQTSLLLKCAPKGNDLFLSALPGTTVVQILENRTDCPLVQLGLTYILNESDPFQVVFNGGAYAGDDSGLYLGSGIRYHWLYSNLNILQSGSEKKLSMTWNLGFQLSILRVNR